MQIRLLIIFSLVTSFSFGQNLDVDQVYDFSPKKLSVSEKEKKLPALDGFWNRVKSNPSVNLPLLRKELNATGHNPFFYFDGASLLLSLSKNNSDKTIAADAISKCDLSDIDPKQYVTILNDLSRDGIKVTSAAVKILNDTAFSFFLVQHVMYFKQEDCLTYMLLPEKREFYVDTLISIFKSVNKNSQVSILYTLWYAYSCQGDSFINAVMVDKTLNEEVAKAAQEVMTFPSLNDEIWKQINSMSAKQAEKGRKESLQGFSDESLDELTMSTLALRKKANCQ
jgi:hypothetical protein